MLPGACMGSWRARGKPLCDGAEGQVLRWATLAGCKTARSCMQLPAMACCGPLPLAVWRWLGTPPPASQGDPCGACLGARGGCAAVQVRPPGSLGPAPSRCGGGAPPRPAAPAHYTAAPAGARAAQGCDRHAEVPRRSGQEGSAAQGPRSRRASSLCSTPTPHTPAPGRGPTLRRGRRRLFSCGVEMILLSMRCSATRSHSYLWGGGWGVACGAGAVTGTGNGTIAVAPRAVQAGPRMQGAGMRRGKQGRRRRRSRPGVCTPPCPAAQRSHPICPSYCSSASQRPSPNWCHTSAPL